MFHVLWVHKAAYPPQKSAFWIIWIQSWTDRMTLIMASHGDPSSYCLKLMVINGD